MKKKLIALLLVATMALSITACSNNSDDSKKKEETTEQKEHFADKDFIIDLQKALQARWDVPDPTDDSTEAVKKVYTTSVETELNLIEKYQTEKFEDTKLQELVVKYVNCLRSQDEALEYITVDVEKFNELWAVAYETRSQLIETFYNDYNLVVDEKYQSIMDEMLTTSKLVTNEANTKETIENWFKSFTFNCVSDEHGYKTYETIAENTTGLNFDYVNLSINLIDGDGVIVETAYSSFNNISAGAKVKFEFSTDKDFASTQVSGDYYITQ